MKKIIALVLSLLMLLSVLPFGVLAEGDRVFADAIYLLYYTLFGEARYPVNQPVDYNKDGVVSSADAIYLLYHTLFGSTRYPIKEK